MQSNHPGQTDPWAGAAHEVPVADGGRVDQVPYIWMNGELVAWEDARIHVGAHALHYGTGVFEGIRAYETDRGPGIFRLPEHLRRLQRSGKLYSMDLPYGTEELTAAIWELIRANELDACYIRPLAFRGYGQLGLYPLNCPVDVVIMCWPWGTYLGDDALEHGVRAKISSWRRFGPNVMPPAAKATGQYLNSVLAKLEVSRDGYEEAILLNDLGNVSEGSGENIFVVRDGVVHTPALTDDILEGITRDAVITMMRDLGHEVRERSLARTDLYVADELFMTGTAAEVTPVREVDGHVIGDPGPVTRAVQQAFSETTRGARTPWAHFVHYAPGVEQASASAGAGG